MWKSNLKPTAACARRRRRARPGGRVRGADGRRPGWRGGGAPGRRGGGGQAAPHNARGYESSLPKIDIECQTTNQRGKLGNRCSHFAIPPTWYRGRRAAGGRERGGGAEDVRGARAVVPAPAAVLFLIPAVLSDDAFCAGAGVRFIKILERSKRSGNGYCDVPSRMSGRRGGEGTTRHERTRISPLPRPRVAAARGGPRHRREPGAARDTTARKTWTSGNNDDGGGEGGGRGGGGVGGGGGGGGGEGSGRGGGGGGGGAGGGGGGDGGGGASSTLETLLAEKKLETRLSGHPISNSSTMIVVSRSLQSRTHAAVFFPSSPPSEI